jgi:uncharacterized protein YfaP (DUF2135 family)
MPNETFMKSSLRHSLNAFSCLSLFAFASVGMAAETKIQILSATVKDKKIADANVTLQRNGETSVSGVTNAQGQVVLNAGFSDDAATLMIVKKPGYSNLVVKCPCASTTYAISPVMTNLDGMRVVLNWGATPADLDSHLVYPGNHVYFSAQQGEEANLDVDDTTSYGPETITIERKRDGQRYIYAVHDYTNRENMNAMALSRSGAKVFVYVGQTLVRTYYVPSNRKGNLWQVFAVTEAGDFQDYNVMKGVVSEDRLDLEEFQGAVGNTAAPVITYSASDSSSARGINAQGEQAYHAGNYDEAVRRYQQAIELDGNYGQAYSNLGLVFQKLNRVSEALWANRKAIALANGPTAATVRASSHYNNAKLYEAAAQWNNALREYQAAKLEKANPAYDKGIERMKAKGAR